MHLFGSHEIEQNGPTPYLFQRQTIPQLDAEINLFRISELIYL